VANLNSLALGSSLILRKWADDRRREGENASSSFRESFNVSLSFLGRLGGIFATAGVWFHLASMSRSRWEVDPSGTKEGAGGAGSLSSLVVPLFFLAASSLF